MTDTVETPVSIAVVGSTDVSLSRMQPTVLQTPDHQPNIVVRVIPPIVAIGVRFANAYITTLLGLVTVGVTTTALPAPDFVHLVLKCASLSLAGPAISLGKDLITILGRLEGKYPLVTGSI
jgi:hypothetical protein